MLLYKGQVTLTLTIAGIALVGYMLAPKFMDSIWWLFPVAWFVGIGLIQISKKGK